MLGKKSSEKSAKNVFYIHTKYRDQKLGGKKRAKQFFQKHMNSGSNNGGKKIVGKKCEKTFSYSLEYRDQKMVEKTSETHFSS